MQSFSQVPLAVFKKTIWGPVYWNFLHTMSMRYPNEPTSEDAVAMLQFFSILPQLIPCISCRTHAATFFNKYAGDLETVVSSRYNLFFFFWAFHNAVNQRLNKSHMSLEEAISLYVTPESPLQYPKIEKNGVLTRRPQ